FLELAKDLNTGLSCSERQWMTGCPRSLPFGPSASLPFVPASCLHSAVCTAMTMRHRAAKGEFRVLVHKKRHHTVWLQHVSHDWQSFPGQQWACAGMTVRKVINGRRVV